MIAAEVGAIRTQYVLRGEISGADTGAVYRTIVHGRTTRSRWP